jgi:hypothetical protein
VGRIYDYGKKGEFLDLDHFHSWIISLYAQTSEFDLEIENEFDLQKQTKWWQRMIQICQIKIKNDLVFNLNQWCMFCIALGCVGINHQKGED